MSKEAQLALRAAAIKKMHEMLEAGRCTAPEMCQATQVQKDTLNGYLRYMHKTLRTVRPTSEKRGKSTLWELGADPSLPTHDEILDQIIAPKRGIRPAQQIGLARDPLVAALFGAAHQ